MKFFISRFLPFFFFGFLFLFPFKSWSDEPSDHVIAATFEMPPYSSVSPAGVITGISVDMYKAIAEKANIKSTLLIRPWNRAMMNSKLGKIDLLFPCASRPERKPYFLFTEIIDTEDIVIATLAGSEFEGKFKSLESLALLGDDLGVSKGYATESYLRAAGVINFYPIYYEASIVKMLIKKRISAFVGYRRTMESYQSKIKMDGVLSLYTVHRIPYGLCISRAIPNSKNLLARFNASIRALKKSGKIDDILSRYFKK